MEKLVVPFNIDTKNFVEEKDFFTFKGHGAVFGNVDFGGDRIIPKAFMESVAELKTKNKKLKILWQHDMKMPLGVFMSLAEDDIGLFVEGKMPKKDTLVHGRVIPQMEIGSVDQMSIGFVAEEWFFDDAGVRNLTKIKLIEISLVTMAMNELATVTDMKSVEDISVYRKDYKWNAEEAKDRVDNYNSKMNHLNVLDVIGSKLYIIPEAVYQASMETFLNDKNNSEKIASFDIYYRKMGLENPFKNKCFRIDDVSIVNARDLEKCFRKGIFFTGEGAKKIISTLKKSGLLREEVDTGHRDDEKIMGQIIEGLKETNNILKGKNNA